MTSARLRRGLLALALGVWIAPGAGAQTAAVPPGHGLGAGGQVPGVPDVPAGPGVLRGRVVHPTSPERAAGVPVVLYALTPEGGAGIRGTTADASGAFEFRDLSNDPTTLYLVGARYAEIPFGERTRFLPGELEKSVEVEIREPTADATGIALGEARLRVDRGCEGLLVRESLELRNASDRVVYVPEAEREARGPILELPLPAGASDFELLPGSFQDGIEGTAERVRFFGPLYPGSQSLEFGYALSGAAPGEDVVRLRRPYPQGAERVAVLTHTDGPVARGEGLEPGPPVTLEGQPYRSVEAARVEPGGALEIELALPPPRPVGGEALEVSSAQMWLELDDAALRVDEQYQFRVEGDDELVAPSDIPLLCLPLPDGAVDLRFSTQSLAIGLSNDPSGALALRGPLPPGESALALRYRLPTAAGTDARDGAFRFERSFPVGFPLLTVFVADTGLVARTDRLHRRRPFRSNDRPYMHLEAFEIEPGETVSVALAPLPSARPGASSRTAAGVVLLFAAAAVVFLAGPLRRPGDGADEAAEPAATAEREAAYAALQDLEHDYETGKVSDGDYETLRAQLRGRAVELLRREREAADRASAQARVAAEPALPQADDADAGPAGCPDCKADLPPDAHFCPRCGLRLAAASPGAGAG